MYRRFSDFVLRWAQVRAQPEPPLGAPGSERTFRAGKNYYYLLLLGWGATQIGAATGLTFSVGFVASLDTAVQAAVELRSQPVVTASPNPEGDPVPASQDSLPEPSSPGQTVTTPGADLAEVHGPSDARDAIRSIDPAATPSGAAPV